MDISDPTVYCVQRVGMRSLLGCMYATTSSGLLRWITDHVRCCRVGPPRFTEIKAASRRRPIEGWPAERLMARKTELCRRAGLSSVSSRYCRSELRCLRINKNRRKIYRRPCALVDLPVIHISKSAVPSYYDIYRLSITRCL